ncbi:MAG: hypothetical protein KJ041_11415, partial [Gammaproteobacteria bacterium]|nr:hypothetical protein [Gammaproteobacteria bacterium]
ATSPYTRATTLVDRLIELFHGRVLDHDAVPERSLAEAVTSDGGLTGAEIAELMVAVLRSYGDPARLRVQKHWKQTGDVPEISGRMVGVQFFYDRMGWVNCFPGAAAKNGGVGNSGAFGMYMSSTGITYHLDTDLRLPVTEEVVRGKRWMINPAAYLVDEDGVVLDCGVVCQRLAETLHKPPR